VIENLAPNPVFVFPFVLLLAAIAVAPLWFPDWWGKHFGKVTAGLAAITLIYYVTSLHATVRVAHTAIEYASFICLIGSLYVISGGIHISIKGEATPGRNVLFLLIGALTANILGTTGASMLLIRPWLRANKYRLTAHHVVFFIFIVSNVGGCLTPVGDPPLFLGYLKGVPFWWVLEKCWPMWATGTLILLAMFYVVDLRNFKRAPTPVREKETGNEKWKVRGGINLVFLGAVLGSIFIEHPRFLREGIMIAAALGSYFTTKKDVHEANDFSFHPIKEVAILFAGIFSTMMPALDWLQANASQFGSPTPTVFFWGSGTLSSVLDNAPTYLSFLSAALGAFAPAELTDAVVNYIKAHGGDLTFAATMANGEQIKAAVLALQANFPAEFAKQAITSDQAGIAVMLSQPLFIKCLMAISVGSVFFGANTYIGNGPNFMVKAIAEQQKAHMPSFFGYVIRFTIPFMIPMLLIVWLLFFWR
jgi:Na+/H+ antiporter NhaD/arsenite permease-like protein